PAGGHAHAAAHLHRGFIAAGRLLQGTLPMELQRLETRLDAYPALQALATDGSAPIRQCISDPEVESVETEPVGQPVIERLLHNRRLWDAEAAEGTGDRAVGVDGAGERAVVGGDIGAGSVDRNAVGHGRSPAGIG